ncbi:NADH-quinone oxidoreductase subunit J [Pontibacter sp. G13]|uniref:NADH-quinone oxidoreductase subunit J family protein n=1 Tax=Pontibacter sp. G13 TaxID=3074898 RepID=UPI00288C19F6|nr:NADH-quinone oxidoreductase subunit J [Pontibacter sp. G13]WNJ16754.1 NADH-quinone oxidoreductase subunit J [Pontibacter sp. G13]
MSEITVQTLLFWTFGIMAIAGGIGLLFNRSPIYAALSLVVNFFSLAGLYLSLQAEFLAAIQVLVYAGAIMVLVLFVIMLLNLEEEQGVLEFNSRRILAFLLGFAFIAEMMYVMREFSDRTRYALAEDFAYGQVEPIGEKLMTDYLFPFEMISVILLAALIGAIVVARKHTYQ